MTDNEKRQMLPEGALLKGGEYRVVGYLASGGFGNTYEVEHEGRLHKHMAVKEFFMRGVNTRLDTHVTVSIEDNRADFERMQRKFFVEAERLVQLDHPHIVEVIDFFEENDTAYYVMKLLSGQPLSNVIATRGPLDTASVHAILMQVLSALKYVHAQHLYHLDLKPGNIMQNADGHCWLIDFGASKQMSDDDSHTLTTTALPYTPRYAPLEQVGQNMEDVGPWTDFYALGATLYNLLTSQMPPKPDKVNEDGESAFSFPADMDAAMRQLILWMMQPRRSHRPQSVDEIELWLSNHAVGLSTVAKKEPELAPASVDENPTVKHAYDNPTKVSIDTHSLSDEPLSEGTRLSDGSKKVFPSSKFPWLWVGAGVVVALLLVFFLTYQKAEADAESAITIDNTPLCPDGNHPHAISLGLPSGTKWACCNIGASLPEADGNYFRWGETAPMAEGDTYATYPYNGVDIGDDISGTRYDAATANWGASWRMPNWENMNELMENCDYRWISYNGVTGAKVTGHNGRSIFFPASGFRYYSSGSLSIVGSYGYYWSASAFNSYYGHNLRFNSGNWYWSNNDRAYGFPVRAVAAE